MEDKVSIPVVVEVLAADEADFLKHSGERGRTETGGDDETGGIANKGSELI